MTWNDNRNSVVAIGTGYSRALGKTDPKKFWGVDEDAKLFSRFVERYCTEFNRWTSPVFIAGESYGGLRAPGMCKVLQQDYGLDLAGLILISPVVDYTTISPGPGNHGPLRGKGGCRAGKDPSAAGIGIGLMEMVR